MLKPSLIQSLPELPTPVLTLYLDTSVARAGGQWLTPPYLTRLESLAKLVSPTVPRSDQELFESQVERVRSYLHSHPLQQRGVVIFAGPNVWELILLHVDTEDEVHWGAPALAQLFWLLDENRPYGVVLADRKRARFFLSWLEELLELQEKEFRLEESKKKEMGPVARSGVRMSRGVDRDVFAHHLNAQYAHFDLEIAEQIGRWCVAEPLDSVFLVGLSEMVRDIQKELPQALREKVVLVEEDLGWMSRAEVQERIRPMVMKHERERETALVNDLLGSESGVTKGIDDTLAQLQQGRIRRLVVVKGLDGDLHQCAGCGQVDRRADPVCPVCNGERRNATLREILPGLARQHQVFLEIVSGEAACRLQEAGGMGAWLREFEKKEYSSAAPSRA
jgi:hypothetical protein